MGTIFIGGISYSPLFVEPKDPQTFSLQELIKTFFSPSAGGPGAGG